MKGAKYKKILGQLPAVRDKICKLQLLQSSMSCDAQTARDESEDLAIKTL